jgi:multidrug efflux pump subunit AcrB
MKAVGIAVVAALILSVVGLSAVSAERTRSPMFPEDETSTAAIPTQLPTGADTDSDVRVGPVLTR